jgi:hypothetical protein
VRWNGFYHPGANSHTASEVLALDDLASAVAILTRFNADLRGRGRPATMSADRPRGFRGSGPTSPHAVHELLDRLQVLLYSALVLGLADLVATIDDRAVIAAPKMRADLDQG